MEKNKIGLALGGGAARGWAHIGVIEALEDAGIVPDYVAGTSIGALVGSVYAAGGLEQFKASVLKLDKKKVLSLLDVVFPKCGLLDGKKVTDFFKSFISGRDFSELKVLFGAIATDLQTSEEIWLLSGNVSKAVRASFAVPGLFTPVMINERLLVDGGLVNPLPVNMVREMGADIVIGVDLNYYAAMRGSVVGKKTECAIKEEQGKINGEDSSAPKTDSNGSGEDNQEQNGLFPGIMERIDKMEISWFDSFKNWRSKPAGPNIFDIIFASTLVMEKKITDLRLENEPAEVVVRPELGKIRFMDFHRGDESIREGYDSCLAALTTNEETMKSLNITRNKAKELKSLISLQN
ncbi:MAG: patatin-like phospholipase family protein [Desulfonatronovibrio sp.]|nr:patatin-like phospholipase family protein [Desulfovibrionales bacterium]